MYIRTMIKKQMKSSSLSPSSIFCEMAWTLLDATLQNARFTMMFSITAFVADRVLVVWLCLALLKKNTKWCTFCKDYMTKRASSLSHEHSARSSSVTGWQWKHTGSQLTLSSRWDPMYEMKHGFISDFQSVCIVYIFCIQYLMIITCSRGETHKSCEWLHPDILHSYPNRVEVKIQHAH